MRFRLIAAAAMLVVACGSQDAAAAAAPSTTAGPPARSGAPELHSTAKTLEASAERWDLQSSSFTNLGVETGIVGRQPQFRRHGAAQAQLDPEQPLLGFARILDEVGGRIGLGRSIDLKNTALHQ